MGCAVLSTARQPVLVPRVTGWLASMSGPAKVGWTAVLVVLLLNVAGWVGLVGLVDGADSDAPLYVMVVPVQVKLVA